MSTRIHFLNLRISTAVVRLMIFVYTATSCVHAFTSQAMQRGSAWQCSMGRSLSKGKMRFSTKVGGHAITTITRLWLPSSWNLQNCCYFLNCSNIFTRLCMLRPWCRRVSDIEIDVVTKSKCGDINHIEFLKIAAISKIFIKFGGPVRTVLYETNQFHRSTIW